MREFIKNKQVMVLVGIVIAMAVLLHTGQSRVSYKSCHGIVWTTQYNITYESDKTFEDSIQQIFLTVDNTLSMFNKSSLISRINRGEDVKMDSMLERLYVVSKNVNKETCCAFDPTVSPLMKAWGFVERTGELPDSAEIDSIREFVGIDKTSIENARLVKTDSRISFDFSAIAKGFACDEIGGMLSRNGVKNYLVEIGGEIVVNGVNKSGQKWHISVDAPVESNDSVIHDNIMIVSMDKGGIATSGNYRNYKDVNGTKVVHTMNPLTGYPEISNLLSATVIAENCMLADAYATACMVMGLEMSISMMSGRKDVAVMLVYAMSDGSLVIWTNETFNTVRK